MTIAEQYENYTRSGGQFTYDAWYRRVYRTGTDAR